MHLSQFNFLYISSHSNTSLRVTFALFLLVQCMIERRWQTENYHLVFWLGWIFATLSVYCQTNRILFYIFGWHEFHSHGATANTIRQHGKLPIYKFFVALIKYFWLFLLLLYIFVVNVGQNVVFIVLATRNQSLVDTIFGFISRQMPIAAVQVIFTPENWLIDSWRQLFPTKCQLFNENVCALNSRSCMCDNELSRLEIRMVPECCSIKWMPQKKQKYLTQLLLAICRLSLSGQ